VIVVAVSNIRQWLWWKPRITPECCSTSIFKTVDRRSQHGPRQTSTASIFAHPGFTSVVEVDSHADSFVAGKNCIPMHCTERSCDVQPHSDDHAPVKNVPSSPQPPDTHELCPCLSRSSTPTKFGTQSFQPKSIAALWDEDAGQPMRLQAHEHHHS
jgi:hypothetical protein